MSAPFRVKVGFSVILPLFFRQASLSPCIRLLQFIRRAFKPQQLVTFPGFQRVGCALSALSIRISVAVIIVLHPQPPASQDGTQISRSWDVIDMFRYSRFLPYTSFDASCSVPSYSGRQAVAILLSPPFVPCVPRQSVIQELSARVIASNKSPAADRFLECCGLEV